MTLLQNQLKHGAHGITHRLVKKNTTLFLFFLTVFLFAGGDHGSDRGYLVGGHRDRHQRPRREPRPDGPERDALLSRV